MRCGGDSGKALVPRSGLHRGGGKCGRILVQDANVGYCPVWVADQHIIAPVWVTLYMSIFSPVWVALYMSIL